MHALFLQEQENLKGSIAICFRIFLRRPLGKQQARVTCENSEEVFFFFPDYACDTNKLNKNSCSKEKFGTHSTKLLNIGRFPKSDKPLSTSHFSVWVTFLSALRSTNSNLFFPKFPSGRIRLVAILVWENFFPDQSHGKRISFQSVLFWVKISIVLLIHYAGNWMLFTFLTSCLPLNSILRTQTFHLFKRKHSKNIN